MSSATSKVELHFGATTDVGRVRTVNEDSYLAAPPVFVVADGMGGHAGGDVASRIVVEEFAELADSAHDPRSGAAAVADLLERCQSRINQYAFEQRLGGADRWYAGTTAVVALLVIDDDVPKWLLANLGDSRIYRIGDGHLEQVSVDHSVVQELLDAGSITADDVATHPERHVVTRALGGPDSAEADYFLLPAPGGRAAAAVLRRGRRHGGRQRDRSGADRERRPPGRGRQPGGRGAGGRWSRQRHGRRGRCGGMADR